MKRDEGSGPDGRNGELQQDERPSVVLTRCGHKTIAAYAGKGVLTDAVGEAHDCIFEACQFQSGQVVLACSFSVPTGFFLTHDGDRFAGWAADESKVTVGGPIRPANYAAETTTDNWATFLGRELITESPDTESVPVQTLRFGLTNLFFTGTPTRTNRGFHSNTLRLALRAPDGTVDVSVTRCDDYDAVRECVAPFRGIGVSAEAVVSLDGVGDVDGVTDVVDDLCYILSVAAGTKIQWVYRDHYGRDGRRLCRHHESRVTKPYNPLPIIPRVPGDCLWQFVEESFPEFRRRRDTYELKRGTIDAYLDAKATDDFLETRGVKLAVAVEELKNVYVKAPDSRVGEFVISESRFEEVAGTIQTTLRDALRAYGSDSDRSISGDEIQSLTAASKLRGLNRRSFRHIISKLCEDIGLEYDAQEVELVIASRNALIHQGQFYCVVATPQQRQECEPLPSKFAEYFHLLHFVDRLYLKLFGYAGKYIDWGVPGKPKDGILT